MQTHEIALVTETFPPEVNGVSLTVARFANGLADRGHQVEIIRPAQPRPGSSDSPNVSSALSHFECRGMPIPMYPDLRLGLPATRQLIRHWRHRRPHIVHVATEGPLGWSAVRAANELSIPVTSDFRTNFHAYAGHYRLGFLRGPILGYLRGFHNKTLQTLVPTPQLKGELAAEGFENLCVVGRGVDTGLFSPRKRSTLLRRQWRATNETRVLLYVGRLAAEKGLELLFDTHQAMIRSGHDVRLVLVGDGPERSRLIARHPHVIFAGQQLGESLAAHFASADLFLFPSCTETFGNVVIEALASGLPIVAFDAAAAALHVTPARNGILTPKGQREQFISNAIGLIASPNSLESMRANAREAAIALLWPQVVRQFEAVLLLHARRSPGFTSRIGRSSAPDAVGV